MRLVAIITCLVLLLAPGNARAATGSGPCVISSEYYLIGGFHQGAWFDASATAQILQGSETYRFCSLAGASGTTFVGARPVVEQGPGEYWHVEMFPGIERKESEAHGVRFSAGLYLRCPWNPVPRVPTVQAHPDKAYEKVVREILAEEGLKNPKIVFEQVLRIDLDGDGVEEVILTASNHQDSHLPVHGRKGDYSLVLLRKLVNGKVENIVVNLDCHVLDEPEDGTGRLVNKFFVPLVADLDGDGVLEIVCEGQYYEGGWFEVFKSLGKVVKQVLTEGVGA